MTFDDVDYVMTYQDYVIQITEFGTTACVLGLMAMEVPDGFNYLIVGDSFMRKFPTYFNGNDNTVSFYTYN